MVKEGFLTDLRTAELFFRVCKLYGISKEKDRVALLRKIVARKQATYLRDAEAFLEGKDAIRITKGEPPKQ